MLDRLYRNNKITSFPTKTAQAIVGLRPFEIPVIIGALQFIGNTDGISVILVNAITLITDNEVDLELCGAMGALQTNGLLVLRMDSSMTVDQISMILRVGKIIAYKHNGHIIALFDDTVEDLVRFDFFNIVVDHKQGQLVKNTLGMLGDL